MVSKAELADRIEEILNKQPNYPTLDTNQTFVENCLVSRLLEVISIYRSFDIEPSRFVVTCTSHDLKRWSNIVECGGIPVLFLSENGEEDHGTFSIMVDADHPMAIWIRESLGIAYENPVAEAEWETRWVFQMKDGMSASEAKNSARIISS